MSETLCVCGELHTSCELPLSVKSIPTTETGGFGEKCAISHLPEAKWSPLLGHHSNEWSLSTLDGVCQSDGKMGASTGMSGHDTERLK